jgi:hypothetical protein
MTSLTDLPVPAAVALTVVIAVQLGLQILALVRLSRAPAERVSLGGRKWLWAVIILVGELAGPIAYFVAGRLPPVADESATAADDGPDRRVNVVNALYGPDEATPLSAGHGATAQVSVARRRR